MARHLLAVYAKTLLGAETAVQEAGPAEGLVGDGMQCELLVAEFETRRPGSSYETCSAISPALSESSFDDEV